MSMGSCDINALKLMKKGSVPGMDMAGTVMKCSTGMWKEGDRVCGMLLGGLSSTIVDKKMLDRYGMQGSCATYCRTQCDMICKVPETMPFEEACCMPCCMMMSFQAFNLKTWPYSNKSHEPILVLGAGTSLGLMTCQLGSMMGYKIMAVCEMTEMADVMSFGAEKTFDCNDPQIVEKIMKATQNALTMAMDCSSTDSSLAIAAKCMGSSGGTICCFPLMMMSAGGKTEELMTMDDDSKMETMMEKTMGINMHNIKIVRKLPTTMFGFDAEMMGCMFKPMPDETKHAHAFLKTFSTWMAEGKMKVLPSQMAQNQGMKNLILCMEECKSGGSKMMCKRLVCAMGETGPSV
ncbi:hypothetical protein BDY24DRAFT_379379 [Mrakia frigida]|uniref:uncharacterized protein n=1 Tax=Mrakia frigida TaxID=29902 RepID=UPI003FCC0C8A